MKPLARPHFHALFRWLCLLLAVLALGSGATAAAPRVLFLGDSFSKGPFGTTLDNSMRSAGLEVYTSVVGGASLFDWLPDFGPTSSDIGYWEKTPASEQRVPFIARVPKLDELVAKWKPNLVVIQGGTNMYSTLISKRRSPAENAAELERLYRRLGDICRSAGAKIYWITPASAHPDRFAPELQSQMRSLLMDVFADYGRVFDSYAVTRFTEPYPGSDGIHYGPADATAWARQVSRDLIPYAKGGAASSAPAKRRSFWDLFRRRKGEEATTPPAPPPPTRKQADRTAPASDVTVRRAEPAVRPASASPSAKPSAPAADTDELELELELVQKSAIKNLSVITYRHCLGVFEYKVEAVRKGRYEGSRIRVAHLIVMNNSYTKVNEMTLGSHVTLTLAPIDKYPNIRKLDVADDLPYEQTLAALWVPKL